MVISGNCSRPHDLGYLSVYLSVSILVTLEIFVTDCIWLHDLCSRMCPHLNLFHRPIYHKLPKGMGYTSWFYTRNRLSVQSTSTKTSPRKDITDNQNCCYFRSRKPSRDQKNKRFFPRVRLRGGKEAPMPLYFHLAPRGPGEKKYLELLRSQVVSETTISSLQYFSCSLSSQEFLIFSGVSINNL